MISCVEISNIRRGEALRLPVKNQRISLSETGGLSGGDFTFLNRPVMSDGSGRIIIAPDVVNLVVRISEGVRCGVRRADVRTGGVTRAIHLRRVIAGGILSKIYNTFSIVNYSLRLSGRGNFLDTDRPRDSYWRFSAVVPFINALRFNRQGVRTGVSCAGGTFQNVISLVVMGDRRRLSGAVISERAGLREAGRKFLFENAWHDIPNQLNIGGRFVRPLSVNFISERVSCGIAVNFDAGNTALEHVARIVAADADRDGTAGVDVLLLIERGFVKFSRVNFPRQINRSGRIIAPLGIRGIFQRESQRIVTFHRRFSGAGLVHISAVEIGNGRRVRIFIIIKINIRNSRLSEFERGDSPTEVFFLLVKSVRPNVHIDWLNFNVISTGVSCAEGAGYQKFGRVVVRPGRLLSGAVISKRTVLAWNGADSQLSVIRRAPAEVGKKSERATGGAIVNQTANARCRFSW